MGEDRAEAGDGVGASGRRRAISSAVVAAVRSARAEAVVPGRGEGGTGREAGDSSVAGDGAAGGSDAAGASAGGWAAAEPRGHALAGVRPRHSVCEACGYAFGGVPIDATGRITCPECGHGTRFELPPVRGPRGPRRVWLRVGNLLVVAMLALMGVHVMTLLSAARAGRTLTGWDIFGLLVPAIVVFAWLLVRTISRATRSRR